MLKGHAFVLAAGAALIALDASASLAQDTTRARPHSTKRISVKKESGEVAPMPRVDTVTIFRTDTMSITRIDTVTQTNTVVRTDTLVQTITRPIPASGNWYGGLAAGVAVPAGGLQNLNETGGTGQLQFGYQPVHSILGGRIDASYSRFRRPFGFADENFAVATPLLGFTNVFTRQPDIWNFNLNLKVQVPGVEGWFGHAVTFQPYLIGGGGFATYDHLPVEFSDGSFLIVRNGFVQTIERCHCQRPDAWTISTPVGTRVGAGTPAAVWHGASDTRSCSWSHACSGSTRAATTSSTTRTSTASTCPASGRRVRSRSSSA